MNGIGVKQSEREGAMPQAGATEIPSYPIASNEVPNMPQQETVTSSTTREVLQAQPQLESQNSIPKSSTPELQTPIERTTSKEGELAFQNIELGQSTFRGGVTSQQLVSKVTGYYSVNQGLVNDPHSGLLQKTASSGDPTKATTWQATVLFKILQAFWKSFGL